MNETSSEFYKELKCLVKDFKSIDPTKGYSSFLEKMEEYVKSVDDNKDKLDSETYARIMGTSAELIFIAEELKELSNI